MSEIIDQKEETKKVGILLAVGIILLPIIFSWILLKKGYSKRAKIFGLGWLGFFILMMALPKSNTNNSSINTATEEQKSTQENQVVEEVVNQVGYPGGMYKIGVDMPAGEYVLIGSSAYFQVSKNSDGDMNSIICNDNFSNRSIVTVKDGQYLTFNGDRIIPIAEATSPAPINGMLAEGMYKVGVDIAPGEYKVVATGMAYMEVSKNSQHTMHSIISNDNFEGERYITIRKGNYLKVSNAEIRVQ